MLVGDIQLGILGLASKHNPADEPSREKRVRKAAPDRAPEWARRFLAGNISAIDFVLALDPRLRWCCSPTVGSANQSHCLDSGCVHVTCLKIQMTEECLFRFILILSNLPKVIQIDTFCRC